MYQIITKEDIAIPQTTWETETVALQVAMAIEVNIYRELGIDITTEVTEVE